MEVDAIVIGNEHYNTLGLIRSLGEIHFRCHYIEIGTEGQYVKHSKYVTEYYHCNDDSEILSIVRQVVMSVHGKCCIYPASDRIALLLDKHYNEFSECCVPNAKGKLEMYLDKSSMAQYAEKTGLRVPKEYIADLKKGVASILREWTTFPCILKPIISLKGNKNHITTVNSVEEFQQACRSFIKKNYNEVLVQEFLHGENKKTIEIMGAAVDGKILFQSPPFIKLREYPTQNGSTSYAEFAPGYMAGYVSSIGEMVKETAFSGLFDLEFIEVNDNIYFIEMNFRNGAPGYALTDSGVNLPRIWFDGMCGKRYNVKEGEITGRLMAEHLDFSHIVRNEVTFWQWFSEFRACEHKMFTNNRDPKPTFYYLITKLAGRVKKLK